MTKLIYYIEDKIIGSNMFSRRIYMKREIADIVNSFRQVIPNITKVSVYINGSHLVTMSIRDN